MTVFTCAGCRAALTVAVSRVALPVHAWQMVSHELLGVLMEPGTYAVNPEPSGPPFRRWAEIGQDAAETLGVYVPAYSLSLGPRETVAIAPGDVRGTVFIQESDGYCQGLDGRDGPNLACARCGRPVATRLDDCSLWQAVWLDPRAVVAVSDEAPPPALDWESLDQSGIPPVEPRGWWSPVWQAAVGVALAHVLAASASAQVTVPSGLVADTFRRTLDALLPSEPPVRSLVLAGPGLHPVTADIALVPQHPCSGEPWAAPAATAAIPLTWDVWAYLAYHPDRRPVPGRESMFEVARRDDPEPLMPNQLFRPDRELFLYTLARLPEVRQPWLRAIYDRVSSRISYPF